MVSALLVFVFSAAGYADTILTGRAFETEVIEHGSGRLELSFSQGRGLKVSGCSFSEATGFKAAVSELLVDGTEVRDADFSSANLAGSVWIRTRIGNAIFRGADLRGAKFSDVQIDKCKFSEADLRGSDLSAANLSNCNFAGARYNSATVLPFDSATADELGMLYVP